MWLGERAGREFIAIEKQPSRYPVKTLVDPANIEARNIYFPSRVKTALNDSAERSGAKSKSKFRASRALPF